MKNSVPNENCLTETQLLEYLRDECQPQEEKAIDRHLTICPMCSDALEGAMLLNNARLERSLAHLDAKIETRFSDKKMTVEHLNTSVKPLIAVDNEPVMTVVKKPRRWLWAAAGVAALVVAGLGILTKPMDYNVASPTVAETQSTGAPDTIGTSLASPNGTVRQTEVRQNQAKTGAVVTQPNSTNNDVAIGTSANTSETQIPQAPASPVAAKTAQNDVATTTSKPINTEGSPFSTTEAEAKTEDVARNSQKDVVIQNAPATSSIENYPGAAQSNSNIPSPSRAPKMKQAPDNGLADYQTGMRFYQKGAFAEAVASLNRVLAKQSSGEVYQNALWYLANSYLKLDKKNEAQGLLRRIVSEKGKYAEQAANLLK